MIKYTVKAKKVLSSYVYRNNWYNDELIEAAEVTVEVEKREDLEEKVLELLGDAGCRVRSTPPYDNEKWNCVWRLDIIKAEEIKGFSEDDTPLDVKTFNRGVAYGI